MKKITFLFTLLTISLSFGQNLLTGGDLEGLATGKIIPIVSWKLPMEMNDLENL